MTTGALVLTYRPRHGPALRSGRLPMATIALSAVLHVIVLGGAFVVASAWRANQPKMYVVNLVPAIAAVGVPQGRPQPTPTPPTPPAPPRATPPAPPAPRVAEPAPPPKVPPAALPDRTSVPELPSRSAPREMPARAAVPARTTSSGLPDPALPTRAPALPRPDQKELPQVASAALPRPSSVPAPARTPTPAPAPAPATPTVAAVPRPAAAPPPPPLGRPTGSPSGSGALTLNVGDFPFAWYLRTIQAKVSEKWAPPSNSPVGQHVVVIFEIGRDGRVRANVIDKTSGNVLYDQAAMRAIADANPFPPLPADFREQFLRVHLGFNYTGDRS